MLLHRGHKAQIRAAPAKGHPQRLPLTYGHIGADILTLASMLRIPVYAHNIPDDQIYRPSAWGLHGTADPEGADFRACANYGPLYGKY